MPRAHAYGYKSGKFESAIMTSREPARSSAYSEVWQTEVLGMKNEQIAQNFGVDKSTVSRTGQRFWNKDTYPKKRAYRKLTSPAQLLVLHLVIEKQGIYLHEVQKKF